MNLVDIIVIIILIIGAITGFKRGFTKQLLSSVGFIAVVIGAFLLKTPVSIFLYENLPFFNFAGVLKGVTVLNILLYEIIAFFIVTALLLVVFGLLMHASTLFERFLKMTIILGIPSKILGALLGIVENFVLCFIILYVLATPFFDLNVIQQSKSREIILENTPVLSGFTSKTVKVTDEFTDLIDKYQTSTSVNGFNLEALDVLLKYKVIDVKSVDHLFELNKLQMDNMESVVGKYR